MVSPALAASPDDQAARGRLDPLDRQDNQDRGVPPGKLAFRGRRDNQGAQETMDNLGCLVVTDSLELSVPQDGQERGERQDPAD